MPDQTSKSTLPLDFIRSSFVLTKQVIGNKMIVFDSDEKRLLKQKSLTELIIQIQEKVFPLLTYIIQLALTSILIFTLTDLLGYMLLKALVPPDQIAYAVRNLFFVSMIAFGFSSVILICNNIAVGLYTAIYGNLAAIILTVIFCSKPGLNIFQLPLFSATFDQSGTSYSLAAFTLGNSLALYAHWQHRQKKTGITTVQNQPIKKSKAITNFLFAFVLIIAYSFFAIYVSDNFDGHDYPYIFLTVMCIPPLSCVIINFNLSGQQIKWKELLLLIAPLTLFSLGCFNVYKFLSDTYFRGLYPRVPAGTWIEGMGLGILIGIIIANFFLFIYLMVKLSMKGLNKNDFSEMWIVFVSISATWILCLLAGAFSHLDLKNKYYAVVWLVIGFGFTTCVMLFSKIKHKG